MKMETNIRQGQRFEEAARRLRMTNDLIYKLQHGRKVIACWSRSNGKVCGLTLLQYRNEKWLNGDGHGRRFWVL